MRTDYIIIWTHGLKYLGDVTDIIRKEYKQNFRISISKRYMLGNNLNTFLFDLYKDENASHIKAKVSYLLNYVTKEKCNATIHVIKLINLSPSPQTFYKNSIKCKHVEGLKLRIRNLFNPKFSDLTKQVFPLDVGISHNHIIHSSDNGSEVYHLEKILEKYATIHKLKIYKIDKYHHKNEAFLNYYIDSQHERVSDIKSADIVLSAATPLSVENHPKTDFVFGPHFGKERIHDVKNMDNSYNNCVYIQPSQPSVDLWLNELKFTWGKVLEMPFGVNVDMFKESDNKKDNVFVYFKDRNPSDLDLVLNFLYNNGINHRVFSYNKRYDENEYREYLSTCKFGIWVGCHESQGFALQEALSSNVPLIVWNVTQRGQQHGSRHLSRYKTPVTSVPYWDDRCGEMFYDWENFSDKFENFLKKVPEYSPRKFVIENVSTDACIVLWDILLYGLRNRSNE